jgi:hypothetical protein
MGRLSNFAAPVGWIADDKNLDSPGMKRTKCDGFLRPFAAAMLTLVVVSGCRTYGGRGSEAATYEQMQRAAAIFQEDLARAQGELSSIQQAGVADSLAAAIGHEYEVIVGHHQEALETQRGLVESLSEDSDYKDLNRAFGAINAQQQAIRSQYERLLEGVHRAYTDTMGASSGERPYSLIPPYYNRLADNSSEVSFNDVLEVIRSGRAPSRRLHISMPDSSRRSTPRGTEDGAHQQAQ